MTEEHQNSDEHWVAVVSIENRISFNAEHDVMPRKTVNLENGIFIPNAQEHKLQRQNYIDIRGRAACQYILCLEKLQKVSTKHIRHKYSGDTRKKTDTVSLTIYAHIFFCNKLLIRNSTLRLPKK